MDIYHAKQFNHPVRVYERLCDCSSLYDIGGLVPHTSRPCRQHSQERTENHPTADPYKVRRQNDADSRSDAGRGRNASSTDGSP